MIQDTFIQADLLQYPLIPLEQLDRIPPLPLLRHAVYCRLFNMRQDMLHRSRKGMHRYGFAVLRRLYRRFCRLHDPRTFQRGNLFYRTAQCSGQLLCIDLIAVFLYHIHHINSKNHGNPQFHQLCGQI